MDTIGTQLAGGRFVHSSMWLGQQTVSSLKRFYSNVLYREVPLYMETVNSSYAGKLPYMEVMSSS